MPAGDGSSELRFAPVILAGGSGTRFWPRSRKARAKQVLALDGERTMIQQTLERLLLVADAKDVWVITNDLLVEQIAKQLPEVGRERILSESQQQGIRPPACAHVGGVSAGADRAGYGDWGLSVGPRGEGLRPVCGGVTSRGCAGRAEREYCGAGSCSNSA